MARGTASGRKVSAKELPIIIGMIMRGDRHHDIAAWFGLNQGRIKDAQDGKYGPPSADPKLTLPPSGPPGLKGRRMRDAADAIKAKMKAGDTAGADALLDQAIADFDKNDP